jgi:2-hydroxychromene-2-carboxylate isomerase
MTTIRFSFDFISPYAYLAWTQIHGLAERSSATIEPNAVLFAGLLNHHGQKGPAEIPAKRTYVFKDSIRRARALGVPIAPPPSHPFNPLLALRAVHAAPPSHRRALIDQLFAATWAGASKTGVDDPATVERAATAAGLDGRDLIERAQSSKDALRAATDEAIARGVFGVPAMEVGGELFWGVDSLDLLERHLRGDAAITADDLERYLSVKPTASRR